MHCYYLQKDRKCFIQNGECEPGCKSECTSEADLDKRYDDMIGYTNDTVEKWKRSKERDALKVVHQELEDIYG